MCLSVSHANCVTIAVNLESAVSAATRGLGFTGSWPLSVCPYSGGKDVNPLDSESSPQMLRCQLQTEAVVLLLTEYID